MKGKINPQAKLYWERLKAKWNSGASKHLRRLGRFDKNGSSGWIQFRDYEHHYGPLFARALTKFFRKPQTLLGVLEQIAAKRKNIIRITEDGPGQGRFLELAHDWFALKGVRVDSTAICLRAHPILRALEKEGKISRLVEGPAELYLPREEQDMIVSLTGSLNYALPKFRKDLARKFTFSLSRGGLMLVGFQFNPKWRISDDEIEDSQPKYGLSENPKPKRTMAIGTEMRGIERAYQKLGFRAKFFHFNYKVILGRKQEPIESGLAMPNYVLIVQRNS